MRSGDVMTIYPVRTSIRAMIDRLNSLPKLPSIETRDVEAARAPRTSSPDFSAVIAVHRRSDSAKSVVQQHFSRPEEERR